MCYNCASCPADNKGNIMILMIRTEQEFPLASPEKRERLLEYRITVRVLDVLRQVLQDHNWNGDLLDPEDEEAVEVYVGRLREKADELGTELWGKDYVKETPSLH